ncbi:MAG: DUF2857 family protein [Betaproteobacteria bacterium]|nr:DUF2857 family protein [Betaproteobacteria bacterium]
MAAYFVSHGASRGMLHELFHLSHNAITRQRRRLGVRLGQGRPPLPDPATRDAIHRRWADLGRHESDLRRRLQQLHHQFAAYPLVVLSAVLHEFDTAPATALTTPGVSMSNAAEHQSSASLSAAGRARPTPPMMQCGDLTLTGTATAARVLTQAAVVALRGGRS